MTVVLSCIEYVCYTVHCMEKLKQTVFLKKLVDGRYYILNSQKMHQPLPKAGNTIISMLEKSHVQV